MAVINFQNECNNNTANRLTELTNQPIKNYYKNLLLNFRFYIKLLFFYNVRQAPLPVHYKYCPRHYKTWKKKNLQHFLQITENVTKNFHNKFTISAIR